MRVLGATPQFGVGGTMILFGKPSIALSAQEWAESGMGVRVLGQLPKQTSFAVPGNIGA